MKVQQASSSTQSFGMALKIKRSALCSIIRADKLDQFEKVLPELKKMTEKVDLTIFAHWENATLFFTATPKNKLGINNAITREIYDAVRKSGFSTMDLNNKSTFVTHAKETIEELAEKKNTKTKIEKETNSFIKKMQKQI